MMRAWAILALLAVLPFAELRETGLGGGPAFSADKLLRPAEYRRWPVVGASLGLSYSGNGNGPGSFHRVYMNPDAYDTFLKSGAFPERTMFVLEIHEAQQKDPLLRGGFFEGRQIALEASVKDRSRYRSGWAYFSFDEGDGRTAAAFPDQECHTCHAAHGQKDSVFLQFYPNLRDQ